MKIVVPVAEGCIDVCKGYLLFDFVFCDSRFCMAAISVDDFIFIKSNSVSLQAAHKKGDVDCWVTKADTLPVAQNQLSGFFVAQNIFCVEVAVAEAGAVRE